MESTKKSAERSASRAATVSRVKGAVKGAIDRLKSTAGSISKAAKSAGRSAKFHSVDKQVAAYADKRGLHPAPVLAARSKDPAKRRSLRSKVVSDIASRVKGKLKSAVGSVKQKAASAAVSGYAAGRSARDTASDVVNRTKQSARNLATGLGRSAKSLVGKTARRVASGAGSVASRLGEDYDLYDIILSHLIDEGYADTYESAERIIVNMSEEWRDSIIETRLDPRGRPASGPMNVYANPKKPSQAHLDAVKAYDDEQKKKTPEQRKAELDAYRNRKMYS